MGVGVKRQLHVLHMNSWWKCSRHEGGVVACKSRRNVSPGMISLKAHGGFNVLYKRLECEHVVSWNVYKSFLCYRSMPLLQQL